ncbi:MAG: hypothetical protein V3V10_09490 [Planctomycetota bacterium]
MKKYEDGCYLSFVRNSNLSRKAPYGSYDDDVLLRVIEYDVVDNNGDLSLFRLVATVIDCNKLPAKQAAHGNTASLCENGWTNPTVESAQEAAHAAPTPATK